MAITVDAYSAASGTHYFTAKNASGQWWNGTAFEAYNAANWTTYAITATSTGNGWYSASLSDSAKVYELRLRAGGSAATTDAVLWTDTVADSKIVAGLDANNRVDVSRLAGQTVATSGSGSVTFLRGQTVATANLFPANFASIVLAAGDVGGTYNIVAQVSATVNATVTGYGPGQSPADFGLSTLGVGDLSALATTTQLAAATGVIVEEIDAIETADPAAIATAVAAQLSGNTLTLQTPVLDGGEISIVQGDRYEDSRAIPCNPTNWTGTNLNGKMLTLRFVKTSTRERPAGSQVALLEASAVASQTGTAVTCSIELTAEQTMALTTTFPSDNRPNYYYSVTCDEVNETVAEGEVTVKRKVLAIP